MTGVHWATPARLPMNVWDPRADASQDCEAPTARPAPDASLA